MIGVNMCLDVFFYQPFENNVLFLNTPMALCPQVMWMPRILLSFDESEIVVDATKKLTKKRNHVSYAKPLNFWYNHIFATHSLPPPRHMTSGRHEHVPQRSVLFI